MQTNTITDSLVHRSHKFHDLFSSLIASNFSIPSLYVTSNEPIPFECHVDLYLSGKSNRDSFIEDCKNRSIVRQTNSLCVKIENYYSIIVAI